MANITNGAKKTDRRKDLWAHVSFGELYAYNPTIVELTTLSKKVINQYLAVGTGDKMPGITKLSDGAYICGGERAVPRVVAAIENFRNEPSEDTPREIVFTTVEVLDPYNVVPTPASLQASAERLQAYINLGLFPLVAEPMSEAEVASTFEKYDSVTEGRHIIGTIVDAKVVEEMEENARPHLVVTIMWEPEFSMNTSAELLVSYAGIAMLRDMIKTPECWVSQDADPVFTNNGVPVYEYVPTISTIAGMGYNYTGLGYLNEALITGNIKLDFVDHLLADMRSTAELAAQAHKEAGARRLPFESTGVPLPKEEETPKILEDGSTYEDASKDDDLAHKLHLYDKAYDPKVWDEGPEDVFLL